MLGSGWTSVLRATGLRDNTDAGDILAGGKRYRSALRRDAKWRGRLQETLARTPEQPKEEAVVSHDFKRSSTASVFSTASGLRRSSTASVFSTASGLRRSSTATSFSTERGRTNSKNTAPEFVGADATEYRKELNTDKILRNATERNWRHPTLRQVLRIDDDIEFEMMTSNSQNAVLGDHFRASVGEVRNSASVPDLSQTMPSGTSSSFFTSSGEPLRSALKGSKERQASKLLDSSSKVARDQAAASNDTVQPEPEDALDALMSKWDTWLDKNGRILKHM